MIVGAVVVRLCGGSRGDTASAAVSCRAGGTTNTAGAVARRPRRQRDIQQLDKQREAAGLAEGGLEWQEHGGVSRQPLQRFQPLQLLPLAVSLQVTSRKNNQLQSFDSAARQPLQLPPLAVGLQITTQQ